MEEKQGKRRSLELMNLEQRLSRGQKRRFIELEHAEAWFNQGRKFFHFENATWIHYGVRALLYLLGLRSRGERNARKHVVRNLRLAFPGLPESFHGYRIMHLSDMHVDGLHGLSEAVCKEIGSIRTDLCVMTGDYRFEIHGPCHNVYHHMEKILSCIDSREGVVGILGNHDFDEMVPAFREMGVRMLVNENLEIRRGEESLWVLGLDDPHYYACDDLPQALDGVPDDAFKILLVHSPEMIREAEEQGVDLYLCGHTHGGQICFPWIGPVILEANCRRRYARGAWRYGNLRGYTSSGVGASCVPVRFHCPPEIVVIELVSGTDKR